MSVCMSATLFIVATLSLSADTPGLPLVDDCRLVADARERRLRSAEMVVECAPSAEPIAISETAPLQPPGHGCGTVYRNIFGNPGN